MQFGRIPGKRMKKFGQILKIDDAAAQVRLVGLVKSCEVRLVTIQNSNS